MRNEVWKRLSMTLLTLIAAGVFVAYAAAQEPVSPGKMQKEPAKLAEQTVTISGKVATVTDTSVTVVDGQKNEQTVSLGPNTKVTKGGKDATLADLKADDSVVVVVTKDENSNMVAVSITAV